MVMNREGHLEAVLNVLAFLCLKKNKMEFDPKYPAININYFIDCKWFDFH